MPLRSDLFYNNHLYKLLSDHLIYSEELLQQLISLLHEDPDLAEYTHPKEGSFFHIVSRNSIDQENVAFRMIYALSNAGADPNVTDINGNTPLHEVFIQGSNDNSYDLVQALFRVGVDPRIQNHEGKKASAYVGKNALLRKLYKSYGESIWAAIETSNVEETERLIKDFIKIDCKHNSNKTLLDKARDIGNTSIIHILANNQVTNEFFHSILSYDWKRASIIYEHEKEYLKINSFDSIHNPKWFRTCSKSILEYSLEKNSSKLIEILFNSSSTTNIDVNVLCTDGLPYYFHCFNENISEENRKKILFNSNMFVKSLKGDSFLFHLIDLYCKNENNRYLKLFTTIITNNPLVLTQRNYQEQTVIEYIELNPSEINYKKCRLFYEKILNLLIVQLKHHIRIEQFILNSFGYNLLIFYKNKTLQMVKHNFNLLRSLKNNGGLTALIQEFFLTIINNDMINMKKILNIKLNIYHARDSFGRTWTHLAVLHEKYDILQFICDNYNHILNSRDNLNRTSLHYACIMNDKTSTDILHKANIPQIIDCMNLYPMDYLLNRDLCCEELHSQNELQRKSSFISNFLKIAFYPTLKTAIQSNSVETIKTTNNEIIKMGFHMKDLNPNSHLNDYIQGERYIPLLFLALEHRSVVSIKCLIELGVPLIGQMYMMKSDIKENSRWTSIRSRAEELECFDIIDIINDLDDDVELKNVFKPQSEPVELTSSENPIKTEETINENLVKLSKRQVIINFFTRNQSNQVTKSQTCTTL